ncbi:unnamed protein product [Arctogadus glacialis]
MSEWRTPVGMVLRKEKKETNNTFSAEEIPSAPGGPTSLPPSQSPPSPLGGGTEGLIAGNTWPEYQAHVVTLKQPVVVGKHTDA